MPKKFSETNKDTWLSLYESGRTERWIAREHARCDPRTVKKGIEEARRKQDIKIARVELVKDALRKHQSRLLEELEQIRAALELPSVDLIVLSWYRGGNSIFSDTAVENKREAKEVVEPGGLSGAAPNKVRNLLREHLKNDRLWRLLAQWDKARASHLAERVALQRELVALLERRTGLKVLDGKGGPSPPFICSYTAGDLFLKATFQSALGTRNVGKLEAEIVADTTMRGVTYQHSILAEVPGSEEACKKGLVDAWRELQKSPTIARVVSTYRQLQEPMMRAREAVEQLLLLGLVPGHCQVCRRLGMY